jgi:hypothetical protein
MFRPDVETPQEQIYYYGATVLCVFNVLIF